MTSRKWSKKNEIHAAAVVSDPRWRMVVARDPAANGAFFYSIATTGVYCRPSCPSRAARPENVDFHTTAVEAERAGKGCVMLHHPLVLESTAEVCQLAAAWRRVHAHAASIAEVGG